MPATTVTSATGWAYCRSQLISDHCLSNNAANVASPNAPLRIVMTVIPTVVVVRNRPGCFASARAARASARPSFAHCCSRLLRADSSAVSASTKTPLARIRSKSSRNASMCVGRMSALGCTPMPAQG